MKAKKSAWIQLKAHTFRGPNFFNEQSAFSNQPDRFYRKGRKDAKGAGLGTILAEC
jgi:hypothetical protein